MTPVIEHANGTTPVLKAWTQQDDPGQPQTPGQDRTAPDKGRHRRADGTAFIVVALFAVAQVAVVAFSGSWQHQYELSIHLRQAHWVAGMQPLSVEGLIASATLVIWYAARYKHRVPLGAYLVLAAGVGQTVLMNLGADYRWPWLGPEISVWPAVAFVAAYEMAVWLVRKRQDAATVTAAGDTTRVATDDKPVVVATRPKMAARPEAAKIRQRLLDEAEAARLDVSVRTVQRRRAAAAKNGAAT